MAANNLTIQEVERSLRNENVRLPAGTLEAENIDLTINIDKSYNDLEKLKQLPIKKAKDNIVRLSDVANLELGPVTEKVLFRAQSKGALNLKFPDSFSIFLSICATIFISPLCTIQDPTNPRPTLFLFL